MWYIETFSPLHRSLEECKSLFPGRTSLDVIFGLPGQTAKGLQHELKMVSLFIIHLIMISYHDIYAPTDISNILYYFQALLVFDVMVHLIYLCLR